MATRYLKIHCKISFISEPHNSLDKICLPVFSLICGSSDFTRMELSCFKSSSPSRCDLPILCAMLAIVWLGFSLIKLITFSCVIGMLLNVWNKERLMKRPCLHTLSRYIWETFKIIVINNYLINLKELIILKAVGNA